jgi:hypothetical protein
MQHILTGVTAESQTRSIRDLIATICCHVSATLFSGLSAFDTLQEKPQLVGSDRGRAVTCEQARGERV